MVWIGVQAGNVEFDDTVRQYDGALLVCDWPANIQATLNALAAYPVPIVLWRFTTDPTGLPGWPGTYLAKCTRAVFANEPDIEGWPHWYGTASVAWSQAGGRVAEPAWSDEGTRTPPPGPVDFPTAHCYNGNFDNYHTAVARANGKDVWITEYADQYHQDRALLDLGELAPHTALFTWQWRAPGNQTGYDLKGVELTRPVVRRETKMFLLQSGHTNTGSNCDASLRGETGAAGEEPVNAAVARAVVAKLMDNGVTAQVVDANFNCQAAVHQDYAGVLALHCQSNPPDQSGWDIGVGNPATDGAAQQSAALALNVAAQYEAATGLTRRGWCQDNPNVQEYYLFNQLSAGTPFALIEMGNSDLDHDFLTGDHQYRVVDGLVNGILAFLGKETLPVPATSEAAQSPSGGILPGSSGQTPVDSANKRQALGLLEQLTTLVEGLT